MNATAVTTTGDITGARFVDSSDSAYYVDPASTSNVNALTTVGDLTVKGGIYGDPALTGGPRIAYGHNTSAAGGYGAMAVGHSATASGMVGIALGQSVTASGYSSVAIGQNSVGSGSGAAAFGYSVTAGMNYSVAIGSGANTSAVGEIALGGAGTTVTTGGALTVNGNATVTGKVLLGGGCINSSSYDGSDLSSSFPFGSDTWRCVANNTVNPSYEIQAYAICARIGD